MVLQVSPYAWEVLHYRYTVLAQQSLRANAGQLQQLGRVQGPCGHDHFAARSDGMTDRSLVRSILCIGYHCSVNPLRSADLNVPRHQ